MATVTTRPSPQQVRDWLAQRLVSPAPPPTPQEVRRQLGWELIGRAQECTR